MRSCLICDDHALVREALAGAVAQRWPAAAITQAADFPAAWRAASTAPELCLVDLAMPGADERAGIAGMFAAAPGLRLLVVTGSHDDRLLLDLLKSGVAGFVPKTSGIEIVVAAAQLVLAGGQYLPPRVADLAAIARASDHSGSNGKTAVTTRQRDVLRLIADGHSNKEIARQLALSPATVKTHVAQAVLAIGALNRTDAAIKALARGII